MIAGGKCARDIRNRIHEGNIDLHSLSYQVFDFAKHWKIVLGFDVFRICGVKTSHQSSKRSDTYTLADSQNG